MSMDRNKSSDGAFPLPGGAGIGQIYAEHGMTLRDYFAAAALTGILNNGVVSINSPENQGLDVLAAYQYADAMLAERGHQT
jgi:hypothetical protein